MLNNIQLPELTFDQNAQLLPTMGSLQFYIMIQLLKSIQNDSGTSGDHGSEQDNDEEEIDPWLDNLQSFSDELNQTYSSANGLLKLSLPDTIVDLYRSGDLSFKTVDSRIIPLVSNNEKIIVFYVDQTTLTSTNVEVYYKDELQEEVHSFYVQLNDSSTAS